MRIVFICAVEFSLQALSHLTSLGANIVGVCTLKDSKFNSDHVDLINYYLKGKLDVMNIYASELGEFPFPRSHEAIKAHLRGATSGFMAAEVFELLRERQ
jgi:hypothetical protein